LSYIKFPCDLQALVTVGADEKNLQNYSLEWVQARLSQCYGKVNIVVDYCAVHVYLHAFSATALEEDLRLTSTSE